MNLVRFELPVLAESDAPALLDVATRVHGVLAATLDGCAVEALIQAPGVADDLEDALLFAFEHVENAAA